MGQKGSTVVTTSQETKVCAENTTCEASSISLQQGTSRATDILIEYAQVLKENEAKAFSQPWSVIFTGAFDAWKHFPGVFGFLDFPSGCTGKNCDRDSICLKKAKAILHKTEQQIEIQRYGSSANFISYTSNSKLCSNISLGYNMNEVVAAAKDNTGLLTFFRWERLQYESTFVLLDISKRIIKATFDSPEMNMSIVECSISPDGNTIAVLYYLRQDLSSPFKYDLYLFSVQTCKFEAIIHCNKEVRPYIVFDPRYKSSRIAIVNFSNGEVKNALVLYCIESKQVVVTSPVGLSIIYGRGYFCGTFSPDGRYFILQKISDSMNDLYVFNADSLKLLKHFYANLHRQGSLCNTNYAPIFSNCGSRMCIVSEKPIEHDKQLAVTLYQLPRPINLQEQCRIIIIQNLRSLEAVAKLPLPLKLKTFLKFSPEH